MDYDKTIKELTDMEETHPTLSRFMKSYLQAKKNALDEGLKLFLEFKEIEDDKVRAILFLYLFQQIINT